MSIFPIIHPNGGLHKGEILDSGAKDAFATSKFLYILEKIY